MGTCKNAINVILETGKITAITTARSDIPQGVLLRPKLHQHSCLPLVSRSWHPEGLQNLKHRPAKTHTQALGDWRGVDSIAVLTNSLNAVRTGFGLF